jgi:hypothetical protein
MVARRLRILTLPDRISATSCYAPNPYKLSRVYARRYR